MSWFRSGWRTFQFTPLREGRRLQVAETRAKVNFNSRPSARGDVRRFRKRGTPCDFNSRPSARGDCWAAGRCIFPGLFQFTPLREGRPQIPSSSSATRYFNSRPSARGDGKRYAISANLLFNPYKSAWLNNSATQFVEIILVIFHRIIV